MDSIARDVASAIGWVWLGALVCASGIVHNQESLRLEHAWSKYAYILSGNIYLFLILTIHALDHAPFLTSFPYPHLIMYHTSSLLFSPWSIVYHLFLILTIPHLPHLSILSQETKLRSLVRGLSWCSNPNLHGFHATALGTSALGTGNHPGSNKKWPSESSTLFLAGVLYGFCASWAFQIESRTLWECTFFWHWQFQLNTSAMTAIVINYQTWLNNIQNVQNKQTVAR